MKLTRILTADYGIIYINLDQITSVRSSTTCQGVTIIYLSSGEMYECPQDMRTFVLQTVGQSI